MTTMMKPLVEVTETAIQILIKELGVVDTVRFLNQYTAGNGDYTEERKQYLHDLTVDDIVKEIKQQRNQA